jgi:hypothetical protein
MSLTTAMFLNEDLLDDWHGLPPQQRQRFSGQIPRRRN